jgi:outer membrane protein assembly factor BamB
MWTALLFLLPILGCMGSIGEDVIEQGSGELPVTLSATAATDQPTGWREWRGPRRDGTVTGITLPDALPTGTWPEAWRVPVGEGLSGVIAADGKVYCHARRGDAEIVSCHDAATGQPIWSSESPLDGSFQQPFYASQITGGPLATPALAEGKLYTVGILGRIQCLNAADGKVLFAVTPEQLDGRPSRKTHGHAASPLVHGGRLHVNLSTGKSGQLLALDADTGELLWRQIDENVTYTSPVQATLHSQEQIIVRTWDRVVGLAPETGEILWAHEAIARNLARDLATPLVVGDVVYLTNDQFGTIAVRVGRDGDTWSAERLWRSGALAGQSATPVYFDGHLYGLHKSGRFVCVDARTGERKWNERAFGGYLSIISFGDRILALDEKGTLALVQLNPEEYEPLTQWTVGAYTWAHVGIDEKHLYLRDADDLVALKF